MRGWMLMVGLDEAVRKEGDLRLDKDFETCVGGRLFGDAGGRDR